MLKKISFLGFCKVQTKVFEICKSKTVFYQQNYPNPDVHKILVKAAQLRQTRDANKAHSTIGPNTTLFN